MLLKSLGLRVYITDAEGTPLPEYQEKQTKEDSIECWVPSIEGANFQIHWEITDSVSATTGCDSCAIPYFDGVRLKGKIASSGKNTGRLYGYPVGPTTIRLYQFEKRQFTDEEDTILTNEISTEDIGTIRLKVVWGQEVQKRRAPYYCNNTDPTPGPIHEKMAKKGCWDAARLGPITDATGRQQTFCKFIKNKEIVPGNFLFRYAAKDVLEAQGIIPPTAKPALPTEVNPQVKMELFATNFSRKRGRSSSLEDTKGIIAHTKRLKAGDIMKSQV
ncbi:unnamed protein product [Rhizoctonia solani]|uniref:DUF7918 domain-containing protein n=1 Tax=Rhizoctonia solani TaxID=456999 RepID=A0A8H3I079_9AGAM|nr:unnamed protein product [Rhizoctonia solani]